MDRMGMANVSLFNSNMRRFMNTSMRVYIFLFFIAILVVQRNRQTRDLYLGIPMKYGHP